MNDLRLKKKAAYISVVFGVIMLLTKVTAYLLTGSSAIFSDAMESVVHIMATLMMLYSIILSAKPPDKTHLYGHGNIEYFSAGIEGLLIIIAAAAIFYSSINNILSENIPSSLDTGTILIGCAGVVNLFLGFYLIKTGKKTNSLSLVADGKHILTDSYTSFGVVVGLILVFFSNNYLLDPIIAIIVAVNILYTGYKLIRQSIGGLMVETDKKTLKLVVDSLVKLKKDYWIDIHQLRFWTSADKIFIDFHLTLPFYFTIKKSHQEEKFIEESLSEIFSNSEIKIHNDYCTFDECKYCSYSECTVRKEDKSVNLVWDEDKLISDSIKKHN